VRDETGEGLTIIDIGDFLLHRNRYVRKYCSEKKKVVFYGTLYALG
jgi:hypothetical protein